MRPFSLSDRVAWDRLIADVIHAKTTYAQLRRRGAKVSKYARLPDGHIRRDSPFFKLASMAAVLKDGDQITRQLLCDYAHACRGILSGSSDNLKIEVGGQAIVIKLPAEAETRAAGRALLSFPYRADIDG